MGDRIAVFDQGVVQQVGPPMALYQRPANTFVAQFLGSPRMNLLPAHVSVDGAEALLRVDGLGEVRMPASAQLGDATQVTRIGVRPESLDVGSGGWQLPLSLVERLGDTTLLHGTVPGSETPLSIKLGDAESPWVIGDRIGVQPRAGQVLLFDALGHRIGVV